MVLYKMQWELSAITPLDFLDHAMPRLGLEQQSIDMEELRRRTETILVLAATDYQFAYHPPSLLAAAAIVTAIQSFTPSTTTTCLEPEVSYQEQFPVIEREVKLRLQSATHSSSVSKLKTPFVEIT